MIPEERLDRIEQIIQEQQRTIGQQNEAVKDLIRVGRILTDAQQVTTAQIIMDRIIRRNGKPPGEGTST